MRLTPRQRLLNEQKIRAAADQLISGDIPPGGRCDVKTLARLAGIDRAAFYGSRPYTALREDFERRLQFDAHRRRTSRPPGRPDRPAHTADHHLNPAGHRPGATITDLTSFKTVALSRITAQHNEITRLRRTGPANVRHLPDRTADHSN